MVLRLTQSLSPVQTVIPQGLMIVAQTTGASVWVVSGHLNQPWLEMHEDIVMHTLSGLPGSKLIYSVLPVQYTSENCDGWRLVPFRLLQVS